MPACCGEVVVAKKSLLIHLLVMLAKFAIHPARVSRRLLPNPIPTRR